MIKSMTGFGKAEYIFNSLKVTVEIKSLNSKQADLNIKMPSRFREQEAEIRNMLLNKLVRGKIDLFVTIENTGQANEAVQLNADYIGAYYRQLLDICETQQIPVPSAPDLIGVILRMPDAIKNERQEITEEEYGLLMRTVQQAISDVESFRIQEGQAMYQDLTRRIQLILEYLSQVEPFEKQRITSIRERLDQDLAEWVGEKNIDRNRFEQELIYYLEKLDITEEKVRLSNHCRYFLSTMDDAGDAASNGKKLGFITQEIGREINTMGSKANKVHIQQLVIRMKDELEKIKEQSLNIL